MKTNANMSETEAAKLSEERNLARVRRRIHNAWRYLRRHRDQPSCIVVLGLVRLKISRFEPKPRVGSTP